MSLLYEDNFLHNLLDNMLIRQIYFYQIWYLIVFLTRLPFPHNKIFPSLKASELSVEMDAEKGFIFMPAQKPSKKADIDDKDIN